MRTLLVFGNGIGRAIDNDFFNLRSVIRRTWNDSRLNDADRQFILEFITEADLLEADNLEEKLGPLYIATAELQKLKDELKKESAGLAAFNRFSHLAASILFAYEFDEMSDAPERLNKFVDSIFASNQLNDTDIATLNYDKLLYGRIVSKCKQNNLMSNDGFGFRKYPMTAPLFSIAKAERNRKTASITYISMERHCFTQMATTLKNMELPSSFHGEPSWATSF